MVIVLFTKMDESEPCYYDGEYPKLESQYVRYYDDCNVYTSYGSEFRMQIKSEDELYNAFVYAIDAYKFMLFTNFCYNQVISCSKVTLSLKNVIDRLILNYPTKVTISDVCIGYIDPCEDIVCENVCIAYDLYSQKCVDGICEQDTLIEVNSLSCGFEPCIPNWVCEIPLNGFEEDGCGNRRYNAECEPYIDPCEGIYPSWICELDSEGNNTGWKIDQNECYENEYDEITCPLIVDPCEGITCPDYCEGTTKYYNGECIDGECTYDTEENSTDCGYVEPKESSIGMLMPIAAGLGLLMSMIKK